MAVVVFNTVQLIFEIVDRVNNMRAGLNANVDAINDVVNSMNLVKKTLEEQVNAGVRYSEVYLEIVQDIAELCNEAAGHIEVYLNKHWMVQHFYTNSTWIELQRISNNIHARIELLQNAVNDSIHQLLAEYYQATLEKERNTKSNASLPPVPSTQQPQYQQQQQGNQGYSAPPYQSPASYDSPMSYGNLRQSNNYPTDNSYNYGYQDANNYNQTANTYGYAQGGTNAYYQQNNATNYVAPASTFTIPVISGGPSDLRISSHQPVPQPNYNYANTNTNVSANTTTYTNVNPTHYANANTTTYTNANTPKTNFDATNDANYARCLKRQSKLLGALLPEQAFEGIALPTDTSKGIDALEAELVDVREKLAALEKQFERGVADPAAVQEMVLLQHRSLDLMKELYAREDAAISSQKYPAPFVRASSAEIPQNVYPQVPPLRSSAETPTASTPFRTSSTPVLPFTLDQNEPIVAIKVAGSATAVNGIQKKFTIYNIEIRGSRQQWKIGHRYNDFYTLDAKVTDHSESNPKRTTKLRRIAVQHRIEVPKMPPKTLNNMSFDVINARISGLDRYLNEVLKIPVLAKSDVFIQFLHSTEPQQNKAN